MGISVLLLGTVGRLVVNLFLARLIRVNHYFLRANDFYLFRRFSYLIRVPVRRIRSAAHVSNFKTVTNLDRVDANHVRVILQRYSVNNIRVNSEVITMRTSHGLRRFVVFLTSSLMTINRHRRFTRARLLQAHLSGLTSFFSHGRARLMDSAMVKATRQEVSVLRCVAMEDPSIRDDRPNIFLIQLIVTISSDRRDLAQEGTPINLCFYFRTFPVF